MFYLITGENTALIEDEKTEFCQNSKIFPLKTVKQHH